MIIDTLQTNRVIIRTERRQQPPTNIAFPKQNHTNIWTRHDAKQLSDADAIFTDNPNQFIGIRTRDCAPIIVYSRTKNWLGAIHAGWRGLRAGIIENIHTADPPADLLAFVGYCIQDCHYEIGKELRDEILTAQPKHIDAISEAAGKVYFNLPAACMISLSCLDIEVLESRDCNACLQLPSHRYGHEQQFIYTSAKLLK